MCRTPDKSSQVQDTQIGCLVLSKPLCPWPNKGYYDDLTAINSSRDEETKSQRRRGQEQLSSLITRPEIAWN